MNQKQLYGDDPKTYELIVQSMEDYAVFTTDKEGLVTTWSAGAEQVMLHKASEIIGKSGDILYIPEDLDAKVPAIEMRSAIDDGKAINERFHVKADGSRFWGSGVVYPLYNEEDNHVGFTKVMRNISDEDQARRNLREEDALAKTLVSTFREPIVILNSDMKVVNVTDAFMQYFSVEQGELIGKDFYKIIDGGINLAQLRQQLEPALKSHEFFKDMEIDYLHPRHGARSLVVKLRRIYQPPNLLFSLEFADLTEGKAMLAEKDIFISVASHEVRTPISVIKAYGQILDRELKDAKPVVRRAVERINQQINYMNALITALLDTSKIKTGQLILDQEVFNLCDLAREMVEGFSLTVSTHEIRIQEEVESMVYADRLRTGTVITNLLSNAVKYSPNGKEVTVHIETTDHHVKLSVQDHGIGIPKSEQGKLFQRFGRTESIKKTKIMGTGLGLHLAAEIIKLEGGEIGFNSEVDRGSTFWFTLPLY